MRLVKPSLDLVPAYYDALKRGWSPFTTRPAPEEVEQIEKDPAVFIASLENHHPTDMFTMPDGSTMKRLPHFRRWMWDGEFCGNMNFRYQHGTSAIPNEAMGHIGYSVVPWKQGRGFAKDALGQILAEARNLGLDYVELHTDPDNTPSQKVILANDGVCIGDGRSHSAFGGTPVLIYRIAL